MDYEKKYKKSTIMQKWFSNNRFSVALLNILLFFLVIWMFNKISFILNPAKVFVSAILPPLLLALIQFYIMNPLVDFLERKFKVPRIATIIGLFALVTVLLIWIVNTLLPIVQGQIDSLIKHWPSIWKDATMVVQNTLNDPHLNSVRNDLNDALTRAQNMIFKSGRNTIDTAMNNISSAISIVTIIFMTVLTAPFILFFMLKDAHHLRPYITQFAPYRWQKSFSQLLYDINTALASYIRGQITVAFWVGVMFAIGYSMVGLEYGIALAVLSAFLNLIPYFGTFIAFVPAIVIAIMMSMPMVIKVLIVFVIEQTIESRIISPLVMGNKMAMHPVTTILLLIGSSAVWGLWGVIFGIPIYAILKIITMRVYNYYRKVSQVFEEDESTSLSSFNQQKVKK
ncbi:Predicted PurR-regulated permease PerM [Lactobacillus bombicola]|uniref:AI-2E family transporter n=1 Tax=Lactobacillus bombicola TaxID=1505723 RepID=A0A1I1SEY6_9LACO|nr:MULTISPECIES: AI-2E family transporter [Lactobacillus]RHW49060.1 AI-2E family transporter [Lactobacillus bombicola]RHW53489.1 AI-2E family transporter [Lactobacillus bombicola]RMC40761.1 AI-2E family transporter [Lactobacillus sp. ESL0237]RMC42178.1 AI-2E family transporter [Lactobacillus sp. ESL0233]RMC44517.1 AI-2E family transporter [Lactobacillus sp. ESL0234]